MRHLSATMRAKTTLWMCVALAAGILAAFLVVVLATPTKRAEAAFPGKNGKIVFRSKLSHRDSEILTMKANGDNKTALTNDRARDFNPVFSPNGKKIAFNSVRSGNWDLFTMSANGTNKKNVTTSANIDFDPAWSPDGTKIAFSRGRGTYVMKAAPESETNRPKRLTGKGIKASEPDWQPLR